MHGMTTYFIRRLLFVPLTFVCITCLIYTVIRFAPGGPVEQAKARILMMQTGEAGGPASGLGQGTEIDPRVVKQLEAYYKLDKPILIGYLIWLGEILTLDFGTSFTENRPVIDVIVSKFPVSIYFGLIGYFASWLVCVPLGVYKAIHHRTMFDTASSILVFAGYAIPGFIACLLLMILFGTHLDWLPLGGFRPPREEWEQLSFVGKALAQLRHTIIPMIGYMIGGFATMTILMKNSLLENFGADYVRTAFAKGLPEHRVIFVHALRNSLIPITAGIGHALGLLFAGSFLIETVCNIPGMGLLGFNAILQTDMPVIMAIAVFNTLILLFGNIVSDLIWALIDPRIRFGGSTR